MFRDCFFPTRKASIEKKNQAGPSKKNKNKKEFAKNKNIPKTMVEPTVQEKPVTLKRAYENSKDVSPSATFYISSSSSLSDGSHALSDDNCMDVDPTTKTTVTLTEKNVPKKLSVDIGSLKTGLLRAKECLRKISPLSRSPVARIHAPDTPIEQCSPPTPKLLETPVRRLPKYRLRTIRRRLFQTDSSNSSNSSLYSVLSGITERTQTNITATVSPSQSFESDFEMNVSMATRRSLTLASLSSDDASSREPSWAVPSPPSKYKDTPVALFFPMDEGDVNTEEKDVQSMDRLSLAENSSISFLDGAVGDICSMENSKTDSSWSDARTPERECDKEFWTQQLSLRKCHRNRSTPRILCPFEDIYAMNNYQGKPKKINRKLSFSSQTACV